MIDTENSALHVMVAPVALEEMLVWLDGLRLSGVINMFGAAPLLAETFGHPYPVATKVLSHWMQTFTRRHPRPQP